MQSAVLLQTSGNNHLPTLVAQHYHTDEAKSSKKDDKKNPLQRVFVLPTPSNLGGNGGLYKVPRVVIIV